MTLPATGPTSREMITAHLAGGVPAADTERLDRIAAAVNSWVRRLPVCEAVDAASPAEWRVVEDSHIVEGATMLGARLYRRKNTPDGVASITADGVAYVRRSDPDIALLLDLGEYAPPSVG